MSLGSCGSGAPPAAGRCCIMRVVECKSAIEGKITKLEELLARIMVVVETVCLLQASGVPAVSGETALRQAHFGFNFLRAGMQGGYVRGTH